MGFFAITEVVYSTYLLHLVLILVTITLYRFIWTWPFLESKRASITIAPSQRIVCWRISNIPESCSKENLAESLQKFDESLTIKSTDLSLYPGCVGRAQVALLQLKGHPEPFQKTTHLKVPDVSSGELLELDIDNNLPNLTPLNHPNKGKLVDVIAVTGIAGHPFGSWRNRTSSIMWLQDLLPKDVENIRILTYGYNTKLTGEAKSTEILSDYINNFINQLENARSSDPTRPIIFIGHSFGGVLIMQALLRSKNRKSHGEIYKSTKSLFFFGVPHRGLDTEDLERMVHEEIKELNDANTPFTSSKHSKLKLLQDLRVDSDLLLAQADNFSDLWSHYRLYSFFETSETRTVEKTTHGKYARQGELKMKVLRSSAQTFGPNETPIAIGKNHSEMVKFISGVDGDYQTLVRYLSKEVKNIVEPVEYQLNEDEKHCLQTLAVSDYQSTRDDISRQLEPGTCEWILQDERYRRWLGSKEKWVLWVSGGPGWGKSVLTSFLTQKLASESIATRGQGYLVAYFFCDDKDERLQKESDILLHLLDQILRQEPTFFKHIMPEYSAMNRDRIIWTVGRLWRVFKEIVVSNARPIYCLVDALDECKVDSRESFLGRLHGLFCSSPNAQTNLKIILTSRPHVRATEEFSVFIESIALDIKDLSSDIELFVDNGVCRLGRKKKLDEILKLTIKSELVGRADGMFLWVSLIFRHLNELKNTSHNKILKQLKEFPKTLPAVYAKLLNEIQPDYQAEATRILQWILYSMRPLYLEELKIAIAVQPDHTSINSMENDMEKDMKEFLRSLFGSLVKFSGVGTVSLCHQSAKEFLLDLDLMQEYKCDNYYSATAESNLQLAITCQWYLSFDNFGVQLQTQDCVIYIPSKLDRIISRYPFLSYAAKHWPEHVKKVEHDSHLLDSFRRLATSEKKMALAYRIHIQPPPTVPPLGTEQSLIHGFQMLGQCFQTSPKPPLSALEISVALGLHVYVKALLDSGANIHVACGDHIDLMCAAVESLSNQTIQLLLNRGVKPSRPALVKAMMWHQEVVPLLLDGSEDQKEWVKKIFCVDYRQRMTLLGSELMRLGFGEGLGPQNSWYMVEDLMRYAHMQSATEDVGIDGEDLPEGSGGHQGAG